MEGPQQSRYEPDQLIGTTCNQHSDYTGFSTEVYTRAQRFDQHYNKHTTYIQPALLLRAL